MEREGEEKKSREVEGKYSKEKGDTRWGWGVRGENWVTKKRKDKH